MVWEKCSPDLWKTLLEGKLQPTNKHVRTHNPVVLGEHDNATALLVLLIRNRPVSHNSKCARVLVPSRFLGHELNILTLNVLQHSLHVVSVIFSAADLKRRLNKLNHSLENQVLQSGEVTTSVI